MRKDLVGLKFNSLTVNSFSHQGKNWTLFWNCVCDCGNDSVVASRDLASNHTKSCGCIRKGKNHRNTHNMTNTKIYDCWHKMKSRCTNKNAKCANVATVTKLVIQYRRASVTCRNVFFTQKH